MAKGGTRAPRTAVVTMAVVVHKINDFTANHEWLESGAHLR
jgi:hypothetical protein